MSRYHTVLLDADMTLLDFRRSEREALRQVFTRRGYDFGPQEEALYEKINTALWDAFARGEIDQDFLGVERFAAFMRVRGGHHDPRAWNQEFVNTVGKGAYLLPGAWEFCQALQAMGLTLAIATNGMPAAQRGRYEGTHLNTLIPHIFISMELGVQKPMPAFFDKVCAALDITDRSQAVMVGDGLGTDILGGNRAGVDTIWYNPQNQPLTGPAQPTWTAQSYADIIHILE